MAKIQHLAASLALAAACGAATAGMHQICYEGPIEQSAGTWYPTGIVGCSTDGAGSCRITAVSNGMVSKSNPYPINQGVAPGIGTFQYWGFTSTAGTFTSRIEFLDGAGNTLAVRNCTINARGAYGNTAGWATTNAVLTGFTTDASGLVSTGVWRLQGADAAWRRLSLTVPDDLVVVGGGAMGVEGPTGALITGSMRSASSQRTWRASTTEAGGAAQLHKTTAYAIGMQIQGMAARDLYAMLLATQSGSDSANPVSLATASVLQFPGVSAVIGGGFDAYSAPSAQINQMGQFGTLSAPVYSTVNQCRRNAAGQFVCGSYSTPTGWTVESRDNVLWRPGWVTMEMLALPNSITVNGTTFGVETNVVSASSGYAAHPAADVGGLRGEYALTSIGARVSLQPPPPGTFQLQFNNLLWKLEPRADLGGASVASKDHVISAPASITAFAVGVRLVPAAPIRPCCIIVR